MRCRICKIELDEYTAYEYRGAIACEDHFDEVSEQRNYERNQIIKEEHNKTNSFKCLDLTNSVIGKANRELLKGKIEIASRESVKLAEYERGDNAN